MLISPALFFIALFAGLVRFYSKYINEFFADARKFERYRGILSPKASTEALALVGYQVFEDEIEQHLQIVKNDDPKSVKKLKKKQEAMMHKANKWKWVGLSKKLMTTHILVPGKTGAGKTELIRSIANEACFRTGGGLIINDGKSDVSMFREFASQAKKEGRETSMRVINFLKAEKNAETNTFSPLAIMHPVKTVEFLGELIGGGGGDGNAEYFFNQGKALLGPVVQTTYMRNKYFKEGYSLEKIFDNTKVHNLVMYRIINYCMCREISDKIAQSSILRSAVASIPSAPIDENLKHLEIIIEYITQNPIKHKIIKDEIGYAYIEIKEIYVNCYVLLDGYLSKIWNQYGPMLNAVSKIVYAMGKSTDRTFLGEGQLDIREIRKLYEILFSHTALDGDEGKEKMNTLNTTYALLSGPFGVSPEDFAEAKKALHRKEQQGGNITAPPSDAVQQMAYSQQQWNPLSAVFAMYKHVFGQTIPEVKPDRMIQNNQFIYVLIAPLEVNAGTTDILGKMIVVTVKEVAAIALMGAELSLHSTLANIMKDKMTPKPFTMIVLEEYGAYPLSDTSLLLAQIRSLSMSAVIAIQEFASLKVGGTDQTSQDRALGNTTKIIAKTEDKDLIDWVRSMMSDISVESVKMQKDAHGEWASGADVEIKEEKTFNPERLRDFGNGFSMIMLGSQEEDLVFVQTFYRGGNPETVFVRRYVNLDFA